MQPADNSMHQNFDNILIKAEAQSTVNLAQLEVYINGNSHHTFTNTQNTPFSLNWQPSAAGTYSISAIAKDVNGLTSAMHTRVITVGSRTNVFRTAKININSDEYYEKLNNGFIQENAAKQKICSDQKLLQGLRFMGINIPANAIIESAHILFETKSGSGDADAEIWTENSANGLPFLTSTANISQRTYQIGLALLQLQTGQHQI